MAHFAILDSNNKVINTITANSIDDKPSNQNWVEYKADGSIRGRSAAINGTYDASADVFVDPQPYSSWSLDGNKVWQAPVAMPEETYTVDDVVHSWVTSWDEENLRWVGVKQVGDDADNLYAWNPETSTWNSI